MKRLLALSLTTLIVVSACTAESASSGADTVPGGAIGEGGSVDLEEPTEDSDRASLSVEFAAVEGRRIIRNASLELHASDTRAAYDRILTMVNASGGFVANATVSPTFDDDDQPQIAMTVRVPVDELSSTMTAIKGVADKVVSESQEAQDVTEQFVDLEARLTNLEALEAELRALLAEVRQQPDADPQKLLTVFNEVASVRGQIEQIQGQLNHLSDLTDLATLRVGISQTPVTAPIVDQPWAPAEAAREALRNLVAGLQWMADGVIGFALYTLPLLIIIGGPLTVLALLIYRRFFRKTSPTAPAEG